MNTRGWLRRSAPLLLCCVVLTGACRGAGVARADADAGGPADAGELGSGDLGAGADTDVTGAAGDGLSDTDSGASVPDTDVTGPAGDGLSDTGAGVPDTDVGAGDGPGGDGQGVPFPLDETRAYTFDGVADYLNFGWGDGLLFERGETISVSGWIEPADLAAVRRCPPARRGRGPDARRRPGDALRDVHEPQPARRGQSPWPFPRLHSHAQRGHAASPHGRALRAAVANRCL